MKITRLNIEKLLSAVLVLHLATASEALSQHVHTALSDGCIVTAGSELPNDRMFDLEMGVVEYDVPAKVVLNAKTQFRTLGPELTGALGGELLTTLAVKVIDRGFEKAESYIADKATDPEFSYDHVSTSYLYRSAKDVELSKETKKAKLPYYFNPELRCLTVVYYPVLLPDAVNSISTQDVLAAKSVTRWSGKEKLGNANLPRSEVIARLGVAGLVTTVWNEKRPRDPMFVAEAVLEFSEDGSLVKLTPRYFRAFSLDKSRSKISRHVGIQLSFDVPSKSGGVIFSDVLDFGEVTVSQTDDNQWIKGFRSEYGYSFGDAIAVANDREWKAFSAGSFNPSATLSDLVKQGGVNDDKSIQLRPINVRTKVVIKGEAPEFFKFLAEFLDENTVSKTLSDALAVDLNLLSAEQKEAVKTERIAALTAKKENLEYWRARYEDEQGDNVDTPEVAAEINRYDEEIKKLNDEIAGLDQGCDPLGNFKSDSCS